MTEGRLPTQTSRVETDYGTFFVHIAYRLNGTAAGFAISHQIKDMNSQIAQLVDDIARGVHEAMRAGPE